MSDKNTYARRSQRHKQEPDICENTNQLNEAVKSKNRKRKQNTKKYRRKNLIIASIYSHCLPHIF